MSCFDEPTLKSMDIDFGAEIYVHCLAGVADIVTDDEVIQTANIDEWEATLSIAKALAKCLDRQPSIMLKGMVSVEGVDFIDDACEDQGASLYLYDGMTLTNIADYLEIRQ